MELYLKLMTHDATTSVMYLYCYTFVILNFAHLAIQDETEKKKPYDRGEYYLKPEEKYKKFEIMYSLKSTWEVINSPQFSDLSVVKKIKKMWATQKPRKLIHKKPRMKRKNSTTTTPSPFNTSEEVHPTTELYETTPRARLPGRQNPFVLVEGTLTNTRRKITRGLMRHTTFMYIRTFRQTPFKYREKFRRFDVLRLKRAFITLQMYITGRDLESILEERPVIMSGFWMRQAVEFIARQYQDMKDLPAVGSPCYKWPADLTKPDLVFFIHTPRNESTLLEHTKSRHKRMVEVYQRMDPPVVVLDESYNQLTDKKIASLRKIMFDTLVKKYPHSYEYLKTAKPAEKRKKKKSKVKGHKSNTTINEEEQTKNISLNDSFKE